MDVCEREMSSGCVCEREDGKMKLENKTIYICTQHEQNQRKHIFVAYKRKNTYIHIHIHVHGMYSCSCCFRGEYVF